MADKQASAREKARAGIDLLKISFEFSPKLGVRELPELTARHESNVKGLYIVGDLADAPIIKVALNQGYEVAQQIIKDDLKGAVGGGGDVLDVVVIGAGPAGIGAALALKEAGARYVVLEKERPFNTIQNFPKAKFVFSEPRSLENRGNFWFDDARKEALVDRWADEIDQRGLAIQQPEEVIDLSRDGEGFTVKAKVGAGGRMSLGQTQQLPAIQAGGGEAARLLGSDQEGATNTYKARRVILAIGRRGSVTRLGVPGEDLEKVAYNLKDPEDHRGRRVMIFGGGDSAVEAAAATAEAGAEVTIAYRGEGFHRAKAGNQEKIEGLIKAGRVRAELGTAPVEIREEAVILKKGAETLTVPNDDVLVFFGTKLPKPFLDKIGVRFAGKMDFLRALWIGSFALMTYCFYVLKSKRDFFPFGADDPLGFVPGLLKADLGFREVNASFWGTVVYAFLITFFGIRAWRKYPSAVQKNRYVSLIVFQLLFLFGIPEILAPLVIDRGYKLYALSVPWPLSIWSVVDAPGWGAGDALTAWLWVGLGAFSSFVLIPLFVRFHGERFCSYLCGCGGLAETLGDMWRHLAPRGSTAQKLEIPGRIILLLAIPVTLMILNDAWGFIQNEALTNTQRFATQWYGLMVDFWLASVVGVAFYPYLGNRVWCRFFCPLRAYMEKLAGWFSKISLNANDKCIGCGECTRYCQMGIPVQKYAQKKMQIHNGNSACIQCGICVQVCPMEVLSIGERDYSLKLPRLS
jgi:NosR/NirI family nitrous oxide reductase transcriptional regulator